jgi:hypothetical protein
MKKILFIGIIGMLAQFVYCQPWESNIDGLSRYNFQNLSTGNSRRIDLKLGTGTAAEALYIGQDQSSSGYGAYIDNRTNQNFSFKVNGATNFSILDNGNIGIGNHTPSTNLHILNTNTKLRLESTSTTSPMNEIEFYSEKIASGDKVIAKLAGFSKASGGTFTERATIEFRTDSEKGYYWQPPTNIVFRTNTENSTTNLPRMIISHNGNVLIGKTQQLNTSYLLDVNGTIRANEIKVNLDGADFVFEDDYNLRKLEEVETFIKENKHLPEIESAKEMQANGTNLGELNTKLLQKIEELTLYMIEVNKEIKTLKQENSNLKEEIKGMKSIE